MKSTWNSDWSKNPIITFLLGFALGMLVGTCIMSLIIS